MDDLYIETLTRAATDGRDTHLARLSTLELRMVLANRTVWSRLMLGLAVKLEAVVKPASAIK